mgnify:CR=1 FL=1
MDKAELDEQFAALYKAHLRDVYSYAYYRVGNHHDAEDLTTQTFIQAYRHFERAQAESDGRPLAIVNRDCPRPVLMCSGDSDTELIRRAVKAGVSSYVVDSVSPERLDALMDVALAQFEAFQNLRAELDDAQRKLSERIVVDRAKGMLMKARGLTEEDAYHALRKLAMERGRKLADVAQNVVITNSGTDTLRILSVSMTGTNPGSFKYTLPMSKGVPPSGGTYTVTVQFCPVDIGAQSASLTIATDLMSGHTAKIPLTGTATGPQVTVSPGNLDFGAVYIKTTSASKQIMITNTGDQPLVFGKSTVTPAMVWPCGCCSGSEV